MPRLRRPDGSLNPLFQIIAVALALLALSNRLLLAQEATEPPAAETTLTPEQQEAFDRDLLESVTVPLDNGYFQIGHLLAPIAGRVGLVPELVRALGGQAFEVDGYLGRTVIRAVTLGTDGIVSAEVGPEALTLRFDRLRLRRQEQAMRTQVRALLTSWLPGLAADAAEQYGVTVRTPDGRTHRASDFTFTSDNRVVVLVHGLDDPGIIWRDLTPALLAAGFTPCEFDYPNDQPAAESADLLTTWLSILRRQGARRITLIGHSMGGLIAREAITRDPEREDLPRITRLILIATPNHGSSLARLHFAGEVRDHVVRTLSGDGLIFGSIFDGAGEAQIDLLPGSDFLTALNARPLPDDLNCTIIAGDLSPVTQPRVASLMEWLGEHLSSEQWNEAASQTAAAVDELISGLGDGLVTIESARLEGVEDFVVVPGNHVTMIRNFTERSQRTPPAIPIVLDRIQQDRRAASGQ